MPDKTRLELDLEHRERYRTSIGIKLLIVLLVISLCGAGYFVFTLNKEISKKDAEIASINDIALMKDDFKKEKVRLISRIKVLETELSDISKSKSIQPNKADVKN